MFKEEVSEKSANSFDPGQFLAAPQTESNAFLPAEQYSYDLDTDERVMAQSDRMPVYACEGVCDSRNQLSKSYGA